MNDEDGLRRALLEHYDTAARDLPWRGETDPYRILVSEVMLQQTRVATVRRYYGPWIDRFPDIEALAAASEDEVLKAWEGLGYYRRARNLHRAAQVVRESAGGSLPTRSAELKALPGIGEYTSGAVASIAHGEVAPAVDGNVRRVLARLFDEPAPSPRWLRKTATRLVDAERPGDWNQSLMELGATICTPRAPRCRECPVERWCAAAAAGTQLERPAGERKQAVRRATFVLGVFHSNGSVLLIKRPADGLLGGLWAFPEVEAMRGGAKACEALAADFGLTVCAAPEELPVQEHRFTHLHAEYLPYALEVDASHDAPGRSWVDPFVSDDLALPVAQRRVLESWKAHVRPEVVGR